MLASVKLRSCEFSAEPWVILIGVSLAGIWVKT